MPAFRTLPLPYEVHSAVVARRLVRAFGADCRLGTTEAECLIATELVTNAVSHGAQPVELTLHCHADEVTIEVADGDPRIEDVCIREMDDRRPGGRGLRVVASLATNWGVRPFRSGKLVWATTHATHASLGVGNERN